MPVKGWGEQNTLFLHLSFLHLPRLAIPRHSLVEEGRSPVFSSEASVPAARQSLKVVEGDFGRTCPLPRRLVKVSKKIFAMGRIPMQRVLWPYASFFGRGFLTFFLPKRLVKASESFEIGGLLCIPMQRVPWHYRSLLWRLRRGSSTLLPLRGLLKSQSPLH